jgi:hypothetical protein
MFNQEDIIVVIDLYIKYFDEFYLFFLYFIKLNFKIFQ